MERRTFIENHVQKVMVIEDDPYMVKLLSTLLKLEGYIVRTPKNHHMQGLLDAILDERPHIALVDVNLAMGSGLDLVRAIRGTPEIKDTGILLTSGLNFNTESQKAGADGFIQKPFMPEELIDLIQTTLNHSNNNIKEE